MDQIGAKLGEKQYKDYRPLTNEERKAMSDKEVELWEERAKSGLVRNDLTLERILLSARSGMYQPCGSVSGSYNQLTQTGLLLRVIPPVLGAVRFGYR